MFPMCHAFNNPVYILPLTEDMAHGNTFKESRNDMMIVK